MSLGFWLEWAKRFRAPLLLICGLTMVSSIVTLGIPWLAAQLLGELIVGGNGGAGGINLSTIIALLVAALIGITALNIIAAFWSERASVQILTELRKRIYNHIQMMQLAFHDEARTGDVLALTSYEVGNLSEFLTNTIANAPAMILTALGAMLVLFWIDPVMALVVPLLIPLFYILVKLAGRRMRELSGKLRAAEVDLIAIAERDLEILPAIKAFAREDYHRKGFADAADRSLGLAIKQARLNAAIGPSMALFAGLAALIVLVLGSDRLIIGQETPNELFAFLLYAALLTRPIGSLANIYGMYQMARGTLARLEEVLALEPEAGHDEGLILDRSQGALSLSDVSFSYPGRPPVFQALNLAIQPGEIVALTGHNGAGKSTLVKLLLRFYEPSSGEITVDGTAISKLQVQHLRSQFGYVPQRPLLFNGTIAENIAFGQDIAPDSELLKTAASLALADQFVAELPDGYSTIIGDHGIRLSGGQRQRIALARALYHNPPIYILDEATAMYDRESEAAFVETCVQSLKGRTVILITHRPASLALADRIVELTGDGIVEIGKPAVG